VELPRLPAAAASQACRTKGRQVFSGGGDGSPAAIVFRAVDRARRAMATAGRLHAGAEKGA